jgi:hypothetical protein
MQLTPLPNSSGVKRPLCLEISSRTRQDTSALDTLASSKRGIVKCRICKEDHWTTQCPYKDTLGPLRESLTGPVDGEEAKEEPASEARSRSCLGNIAMLLTMLVSEKIQATSDHEFHLSRITNFVYHGSSHNMY